MRAALAPRLSAAVAEEVRHRLVVLDLHAAGVTSRVVDVELIRAQLRSLITAWRRLLETHHPADGESRCPRCRSWWGRRRRWPCAVWRIAQASLAAHQEPAAEAVHGAVAWTRGAPHAARPPGTQGIPVARSYPAGAYLPLQGAGGTSGVAVLDRSGAAAPDTSFGSRRALPEPDPVAPCPGSGAGRGIPSEGAGCGL